MTARDFKTISPSPMRDGPREGRREK